MVEDGQWMIPSSPPIDIWVGLTSFPIPWGQLQGGQKYNWEQQEERECCTSDKDGDGSSDRLAS